MPFRRSPLTWGGAAVTIALGVTGCGGASSAAGQASGGPSASTQPGAGAGGTTSARPGTAGSVAAISGSDLEVQNPTDGQVTVHLTPTTKIISTVAAAPTDLKVGGCAVVQPVVSRAAGGASSTASPSVDPTAPVAARSVTLADPIGGGCTTRPRGLRGAGGGAPSAGSSAGAGSGQRTGQGPGGLRGGRPAAGQITAVAAGGFTVRATDRAGAPTIVTVTTTGQTTYSRSQKATPAAIKVGSCVVAQGRVDGTGAVTATSVAVQAPTANGCRAGSGRRGGGSAAPNAGAGTIGG